MGQIKWNSSHLRYLSDVCAPLSHLTKKGVDIMWAEPQEKSFQVLKKMMVVAPVLQPPDWTLPFHVFVDASDIAIGVVLMQEKIRGWYRPIYYASRMLTMAERNYSVTEMEALGMIYSLNKFRHYLLSNRVMFHVMAKDMTEDQLSTYHSLIAIGYAVQEAKEAVMPAEVLVGNDPLQGGESLLTTPVLPRLGTSLKIAKKKQLFSITGVGTSELGDEKRSQFAKKEEEKESQVFAGSSSVAKDVKGLLTIQEVTQLLSQLQLHVVAQDKVVSNLLTDN